MALKIMDETREATAEETYERLTNFLDLPYVRLIPRSTETGTESVPVLQIKNFSVPVSVP